MVCENNKNSNIVDQIRSSNVNDFLSIGTRMRANAVLARCNRWFGDAQRRFALSGSRAAAPSVAELNEPSRDARLAPRWRRLSSHCARKFWRENFMQMSAQRTRNRPKFHIGPCCAATLAQYIWHRGKREVGTKMGIPVPVTVNKLFGRCRTGVWLATVFWHERIGRTC